MPLAALFPPLWRGPVHGGTIPHCGEAGRELLQRREGRKASREDPRAYPPDAPRRRTRGGARGRRPARIVEGLPVLRRRTTGPEPRLGPGGPLLRPFALPSAPPRSYGARPVCALAFVDDGGRHPTVPHSPPRSFHSPSRLLANHKSLYVKNHSFAVSTLFPLMLESYACKLGTPHSYPLRETATRLFYSKNGADPGPSGPWPSLCTSEVEEVFSAFS